MSTDNKCNCGGKNGNAKWRVCVIDHYRNKSRGGHGTPTSFNGLPGVEICAVADPDQESREKLLEETGAKAQYADWREMLAVEKPNVACLTSRHPDQHTEVVIGAAEAGCHIYCEKPFSTTLDVTDKMVDAADRAGVKIAVAHLARYSESFQTAREMISRGDIGRPVMAYCRGKEDDRGGGEDMITLGTHLFDISRFLFGDPEWVFGHVTQDGRAMVKSDAHDPTEPVGTIAGDEIVALFGFPGNFHCNFESRKDMFHEGGDTHLGIVIVGTKAKLAFRYHGDKRVLRICRSASPFEEDSVFEEVDEVEIPDTPGAEPLPLDKDDCSIHAYFTRCNRRAAWDLLCAVEEGREPLASGKDARWALEMIHGVYTSHLSGSAVSLPLKERKHPLE